MLLKKVLCDFQKIFKMCNTFFFNSRVLLETMQSKRFAVNKYYMPMQRLH